MDNGNGLTASDVALLNNNNDGFGNNSCMWFIAIIFLIALMGNNGNGFGFGGNNNGSNNATQQDVYSGFNFNGVNNQLDNLMIGQSNLQQVLGKGICDSAYETNMNIKTCCCDIKELIGKVQYDMSMQNNQTQNMIMKFAYDNEKANNEREMRAMRSEINQLQLAAATCGIPKTNPYGWAITQVDPCRNNYGGCCGY